MAEGVAHVAAGPRVREWARRHGFSEALAARLVRVAGDDAPRFLEGLLTKPPRYVRVNRLRAGPEEVARRLSGRGFEVVPSDLDACVLRVDRAPGSPGATLEHLLGMTSPQDVASAAPGLALGARPDEVVADLAAAPGMKTVHVAGDQEDRGVVVAVEPAPRRARALRFNLERCGVASALVRMEDARAVPGEAWADRVLLDAPCTGEGTLPRDRSRRRWRPEETARMAALQRELVDAADRVLRPGGVLVYATCTFAPEENEAQVQRLVGRGYTVERLPFAACGGVPLRPGLQEWPGLELDAEVARAARFLPGLHGSLGFFVARLRKPEGAP